MNFSYYYNQMPDGELCRNNLIYTSLISDDKKVFCQWYYNDGEYHKGQNQVVDPELMEQKWRREVQYLQYVSQHYPVIVPDILNIDYANKKIYLAIDGPDFWQRSLDGDCSFDEVLPDWQDQMISIINAYRTIGLHKYSMHPSSYFIVDGKLKAINYFFTYNDNEGPIVIADHLSHIYSTRQEEMRKHTEAKGISWTEPQSLEILDELCWDSFSDMYPADFIERARCIK